MTGTEIQTEGAPEVAAPADELNGTSAAAGAEAAASPDTDGTAPETQPEDRRRRRKILVLLFLLGALVFLLGLAIWYLLFRQPVVLPGVPENQVPHFNTAFTGIERPVGIAVSPAGDRIYVAQTESARDAVVLDGSGKKLASMLPPVSTGTDHAPVYVARDPISGEVYVSDRLTGAIYIYDSNGTFQRQFEPKVDRPGWQPLGLAFDKAGNLYVTDLGAKPQVVVEFDRTGTVVRTVGASDALNFPNGLAVDDRGYVYVTDSNNGRLMVYDATGKRASQIGRGAGEGNLGLPRGIAVDGRGHVFTVDASGQAVFVYREAKEGQPRLDYLGTFGAPGSGDGQFMFPNGVAVDGAGRIYVTDSTNGRVQLWNY